MCQQVVNFCSGSAKPLLLLGSVLTLLMALAIGWTGVTTNCLYRDLDPRIAEQQSHIYYAQILAACYLTLLTLFVALAAHFDQKQSIRVLAILTSLNFLLAVAAILTVPGSNEVLPALTSRLEQAQKLYDRTEKPAEQTTSNQSLAISSASTLDTDQTRATPADPKARLARMTGEQEAARDDPLSKTDATKIWDSLQSRGCCGLRNAFVEWYLDNVQSLPKSCCSSPTIKSRDIYVCEKVDPYHDRACLNILRTPSLNLSIVLALIALVNLFLATVSGVSTYRTFHYSEASQNAYS